MMPASLRDSPKDVRCLCSLSADNLDARAATSDRLVIRTKARKISSCKTPAARLRSPSCPIHEAKWTSPPLRSFTRTTEPAAKSP
jgi:hypothetical protein